MRALLQVPHVKDPTYSVCGSVISICISTYTRNTTLVFSLNQTEYDSEQSFHQGSRKSVLVMRGSPFLTPRPRQNLRAFFGHPKRGQLSNSQSVMVLMNILTKPEAALWRPAASMSYVWNSFSLQCPESCVLCTPRSQPCSGLINFLENKTG